MRKFRVRDIDLSRVDDMVGTKIWREYWIKLSKLDAFETEVKPCFLENMVRCNCPGQIKTPIDEGCCCHGLIPIKGKDNFECGFQEITFWTELGEWNSIRD